MHGVLQQGRVVFRRPVGQFGQGGEQVGDFLPVVVRFAFAFRIVPAIGFKGFSQIFGRRLPVGLGIGQGAQAFGKFGDECDQLLGALLDVLQSGCRLAVEF